MNILLTQKIPDIGLDKIKKQGHTITLVSNTGIPKKEEIIAHLKDKKYEAMISLLTDNIDEEVLKSCDNLKIIANYAVGFNNINIDYAKQKGIMVTNTPGVLTDTVAEHTVALILSVASRIAEADRFTRAGKYKGWGAELLLGSDLKNKTLGILGAGRIGAKVAKIMNKGFGMKVIYFDLVKNEDLEKETKAEMKDMDYTIKNADVLSVHLPLNDKTKYLFDEDTFKKMKKSAIFINAARGLIVNENSLAKALKEEVIWGAGIDVFENEPKIDEELLKLENVILTPHIASASKETRNKMSEIVADNIISVLDNKSPITPVFDI